MRFLLNLKHHSVASRTPHNTRYAATSMLLFLTILLFNTACSSKVSTEPVPPTIHYGEDLCEFCNMIISEERFAAGYLTQDGEEWIFDDIGGMFQHHLQQQEDVMAFFVHDYEDRTWIRAETAHYVISKELPTPMLFGIVAYAESEKAELIASRSDGEVLTFDEVMVYYQEPPIAVEDK